MNKLNESEQEFLDTLVAQNDRYRRGIANFMDLQAANESQIIQLVRERETPLKVAYTSGNRRICFDGGIVKIEKHPRIPPSILSIPS